jgi:HD-like signal output (HDOD) protein
MASPPDTEGAPTPGGSDAAPSHNFLASWTGYFSDAEIPVLAETSRALEELRAVADDVDVNAVTAVIQADPLMTLKLLAHVAGKRRAGDSTETESIKASLVMMGLFPFFADFGLQPTVEDRLRDKPQALEGLLEVLHRAERGARFAVGFAVHRGDLDAGAIYQAALLHDFAEMLTWCHVPKLALQIREAQRADPTLRSAAIQRNVLHIELQDLRQALMKKWRLPELLVRISDERHAEQANVRNVVLAVRLARHTMLDWDNPALPDDINDIAQLLNASPRVTLAFLHKIDQSGS